MNKKFHNFLMGVSVLPALLVMPAMAAAPNTTDTAFVFGDVTATAGTPLDYMGVGGRRISTDIVGGKYRNDFPNYAMIGRSFEIPASDNSAVPATTLYVGPVNLTLRELTNNDVFKYNYQYQVAYDEATGQYVEISDPDTDVDLADWTGVVWNDDDVENKVAAKIGAGNASYTADGVEMFSRRDNTKVAGSLSIAKTNATVDGTTVNANSISVTQGSTLTVANKATALLNTATRWYSVADQIASSGMTTLNAQTITFDASTINLDHVVVKENNIPVGIRDANLVINSETPTGITTIQNVASGYGALTVNGGGSLDLGGAELNFTNNTSTSHGAGLYYKDQSYGSGAQHGNNIAVLTASDITFSGNEVLAGATSGSGAGIFLSGGKLSVLGDNNTFTDNHMNATIANNRLYKTGGGAIANQSYDLESGQFGDVGSAIDADMIIGKADGSSVNTFTDNTSTTNGGAIMNRAEKTDGNATLTINGTTIFDNNSVDINGGAIYNLARNDRTADVYMNNGTYTFTANSATELGGAIYNEGTMQLSNATFGGVDLTDPQNPVSLGNSANKGGAIYNAGTISLTGGAFVGNTAVNSGGAIENKDVNSALTLTNVNFNNNSADWAGAVEVRGTVNISGGSFTGNTSNDGGGAIYLATLENKGHKLTIDGTTFTNNGTVGTDVDGGGAIGSFSDLVLRNATFTGNYFGVENVNTVADGGGAIMMGSVSTNLIENTTFTDNTSKLWGGAISMRDVNKGDNDDATLDMNNVTFTHNTAVYGGAIYNTFHNDANDDGYVSVNGATFNNNIATNNGGALYNSAAGTKDTVGGVMQLNNSTFTGNTAGNLGGAIVNYGIITLAGTNTFTGNTANGLANDIYNVGTLTVESGTTTMDGGIDGTGTLTVADGATLNIGTATIKQGTITLDSGSTLIATLRDGASQLNASSAFSGGGTLSLVFSNAGTYHVFGDNVLASAKDQVKSLVYDLAWTNEDKDVIATLKSAAEIAESTGIEQDSAVALSGLTQSSSEKLNDLSTKIQEKLAEATPEAKHEVEQATKAIHPEKESVTQSVAASVQTAVTNLASARMAAPTIGRNGGDLNLTSGGVWAQGLFNKSKQNNSFDGYTRGVAVGLDGTINKVWTVGAGYSYAHSDVNGSARDTEIDSNTVFVYGQYKPAEWYVNAVANYTMSDYSEKGAALGTPVTADYDIDSFGGAVATGYDFATGITPELGLRYMHVNADAYTNSLGVKTSSKDTDFLTGILGAKYMFNVVADKYTTFIPQLNAALKYDLLSDRNVSTVAMPGVDSYTLRGERLSRFGGEFGIGLGIKYRSVDFSINYDIDVRKDYTSQTGMLKFRYNF